MTDCQESCGKTMAGKRKPNSRLVLYRVYRNYANTPQKCGSGRTSAGSGKVTGSSPTRQTRPVRSPDRLTPAMGSESILSGELGDSECSTQRSDSPSPAVNLKAKKRAVLPATARLSPRNTSSHQQGLKTTRMGKRQIKVRSQPRKGKRINMIDFREESSGLLDLDHKFEVPIHRDPVREPFEAFDSSEETQEIVPVDVDRASTDSEEYDTDLEENFQSPRLMAMDMSGRTRYLHMCTKLGVAPCSLFLRQALEEKLNLRYYGLLAEDALALSKAFLDNTYITHVDLSYNAMGTKGLLHIAKSLRENHYITHIELTYCFLGRDEDGAKTVYGLVKASNNIHHMNLSHNCFKSRDYVWLAQLLKLSSRLYSLDLGDNELGPFGVKVFAESLAENEILEQLDMQWNPLLPAGNAIMLDCVARNMTLKQLSLARTGMNSTANELIANMVSQNDFLQDLDLRKNHFSPSDIGYIERAMEKSKSNLTIMF